MTEKITLELTKEEFYALDRNIMMVEETESILEKIKEGYKTLEPLKSPVEEAYKKVFGVYPTNEITYNSMWGVFQKGYYAAKEETAQEPEKSKINDLAEKLLSDDHPYKIADEHGELNPYKQYLNSVEDEKKMEELGFVKNSDGSWTAQPLVETAQDQVKKLQEKEWALNECKKEEQEVEPSMTNCVITGNPPDGYITWQEWYNELGSKGILHNLRISSIESIEQEVREWDVVRESVKWYPGKAPLDWVKPQTPEQVSDGLKEAFREAIKQGIIPEVDKVSDEFMDEMVAKLKGQTLYDVCVKWNDDDSDPPVSDLIDRIEEWLPKPQNSDGSQNAYVESAVEGFNDCLNTIKRKLR